MIESSIGIFLAFWLLWIKLPLIMRLKALNHPFLLDLSATVLVFMLYGGTGYGALAATFAAVVMSINISFARHVFGYIGKKDGEIGYFPGRINLYDKILKEMK
jgi:hypothetical protein